MVNKIGGDIEAAKSIFSKVFDGLPFKAVFASFMVPISWVFQQETTILISVYTLLALDTLTGIMCAIKGEGLESSKLSRILWKCLIYFIMLVVGRIVDKHLPIGMAAPIMDAFIVATEGLSILENISLLGFPVPTSIVKMLKKYRDKNNDVQN